MLMLNYHAIRGRKEVRGTFSNEKDTRLKLYSTFATFVVQIIENSINYTNSVYLYLSLSPIYSPRRIHSVHL